MKIPLAHDVAGVIGDFAQKVENRSLLLDKFAAQKAWPPLGSLPGKWDDATRWNFLRLAENGDMLLKKDEDSICKTAENRNGRIKPEKVAKALALRPMVQGMMQCACRTLPREIEDIRLASVRHWHDLLGQDGESRKTFTARLEARLALNLSGGLLQNAGIALDRMFGAPYIPGSAIKGVCRKVALEKLGRGEMEFALFQTIFGSADSDFKKSGDLKEYRSQCPAGEKDEGLNRMGAVVFLPAFPTTSATIAVDLSTVHFGDYYNSGNESDLKTESPKPNPFPVVKEGTEYLFSVALNGMLKTGKERTRCLETARSLLREAVENAGIGAKTGAGYGWFSDLEAEQRRLAEEEAVRQAERDRIALEEEKRRQEETSRREALSPEERDREDRNAALQTLRALSDEQFATFVKGIQEKSRPEILAVAELLGGPKRDRWKTWKKRKPDLAEAIRAAVKTVGVDLP